MTVEIPADNYDSSVVVFNKRIWRMTSFILALLTVFSSFHSEAYSFFSLISLNEKFLSQQLEKERVATEI